MKKAWIENGAVREVCVGNPEELYHPDFAVKFDTDVPDETLPGATLVNGVWTNPTVVVPEPLPPPEFVPPMVSAIQFKMLFTTPERIATKASTDPVIQDSYELLNDPRVSVVDLSLKSIQDLLDYMTLLGIIAEGRKAEILTGEVK